MQTAYLPDFTVGKVVTAFGQTAGWQISKYNIPEVWAETEGEDITIAMLDTGCQMSHPDLKNSLSKGYNPYADNKNVNDGNGHGTHCAGIVTANNNEQGIVGVAPKAKILVFKVLEDNGVGTSWAISKCIHRAIDAKVDIISMSLGSTLGDDTLHGAVKRAYEENIPVICAAGNFGDIPLLFPARYPETISIGALTDQNIRAEFSQTGSQLDFMAPGVSIYSTYPTDTYEYATGTSMATPWAAGVVALMMTKHRKRGGATPLNTVEDIRNHLKKTAIDLNDAGKDPKTGYGLVDVVKAINTIKENIPEGEKPMPNFEELTSKFNDWVHSYNNSITERDKLKQQIAELQAQLDDHNARLEAMDATATKISELLG